MRNRPQSYLARALVFAIAVAGFGCATTGKPPEPTAASRDTKKSTGSAQPVDPSLPQINSHAKLLFEDAVKAFESQKKTHSFDYDSLARKFQAALSADSNLAEAEYNLGVIAERQGKTDEAASHYRSALRTRPSLKEAAENLAVISQNNGDVHGALRLYQEILDQYPDDAASRARIAELYRLAGDYDRALELARQSLMREPKSLQALKVMLFTYIDRREFALAKLVSLRASKIDETDAELHYALGIIALQETETEKALVQFKKAVAVRPDYLPARIHLAKIALDKEDYKEAEESLRRILQNDGKNAAAHLNLGIAYRGLGQYDKAMVEYDLAEKFNPDLPAVYLNKGIILHRYKDAPERGLELYTKYLALSGGGVSTEAPVFSLINEAQQVIATKEEAKRMEAEQKRQDEEDKRNKKTKEQQDKANPKGEASAKESSKQPKLSETPRKGSKQAEKPPAVKPADKPPVPKPDKPPAPEPRPAPAERADEPKD
jgi:tetratricopeptide (TPR) repeat protein